MTRILVASMLVLGAASTLAASPPRLPTAPVVPTTQDCMNLRNEFDVLARRADQDMLACTRGRPSIAQGEEVLWFPCRRRNISARAWPQCADSEFAACEMRETQEREVQDCLARVRVASDASAQRRAQMERDLKRVNDVGEATRDAIRRYQEARRFMNDPRRFLLETLARHSQKTALDLFDPFGQLKPSRTLQASEVYRYAWNVANSGTDLTPNIYVRTIQKSALREVSRVFSDSYTQFEGALNEADRLGSEWAVTNKLPVSNAPVLARPPAITPASGPDCSVFSNPTASTALRDRDEKTWLELLASCAPK